MKLSNIDGARRLAKQYGLDNKDALYLAARPDIQELVFRFREENGWPACTSPLVRGFLLDALKNS